MGYRWHLEPEGDVEGHAAGREIEVERMTLTTSDGKELTLEPEGEDGDRLRVVSGPDDLVGHGWRPRG